jgi:hypothetical protein
MRRFGRGIGLMSHLSCLNGLWSGVRAAFARLRRRGWQLCERLFALRDFLAAACVPPKPAPKRTFRPALETLESILAPQDVWSLLPAAGMGVPLLTPSAALFDGFAAASPRLLPAPPPVSFRPI